ncbi:MAG: hypothetical protein P8Z68_08835 [Kineosporiaceae bacterium]
MTQTLTELPAGTDTVESVPEPTAPDRAAGRAALADIIAPVRAQLAFGTVLAVVVGILGVVPFIVLVELGGILVTAADTGATPDPAQVNRLLLLLLGAFGARVLVYVVALMVTHLCEKPCRRT